MKRITKWPRIWPLAVYSLFVILLAFLVLPEFFGIRTGIYGAQSIEDFIYDADMLSYTDGLLEQGIAQTGTGNIQGVFVMNKHGEPDAILEAYRTEESREYVEMFFSELCGSAELAGIILFYSSEFNIPPALAFSLCWEESRYYPRAVNRKNRNYSVDRGLFQLNNSAFPFLTEQDFFDPSTNSRYGLSHLRWCLDYAGTEVAGLAMYNAGTGRVRSGETPKTTLDYISRILNRQRQTEEHFLSEYIKPVLETIAAPEETKKEFVLSLLTPLGRP